MWPPARLRRGHQTCSSPRAARTPLLPRLLHLTHRSPTLTELAVVTTILPPPKIPPNHDVAASRPSAGAPNLQQPITPANARPSPAAAPNSPEPNVTALAVMTTILPPPIGHANHDVATILSPAGAPNLQQPKPNAHAKNPAAAAPNSPEPSIPAFGCQRTLGSGDLHPPARTALETPKERKHPCR